MSDNSKLIAEAKEYADDMWVGYELVSQLVVALEVAEAQVAALREVLQWYVDNDDTNEGGDWEKVNAFRLEGRNRAIALLAALATEGPDKCRGGDTRLFADAADEIMQLRKALEFYKCGCKKDSCTPEKPKFRNIRCGWIARAALKENE